MPIIEASCFWPGMPAQMCSNDLQITRLCTNRSGEANKNIPLSHPLELLHIHILSQYPVASSSALDFGFRLFVNEKTFVSYIDLGCKEIPGIFKQCFSAPANASGHGLLTMLNVSSNWRFDEGASQGRMASGKLWIWTLWLG